MTILRETLIKIRAFTSKNVGSLHHGDLRLDPAAAIDAAIQSLVVLRVELRMRAATA